jgi:glucokinase
MSHVLAADIGGTKTIMALAARGKPWSTVVAERTYASRDFSMLEAVIQNFMARPEVAENAGNVAAACFAVAGPVVGSGTTLTNLGWRIDAREIAARFRLPAVTLVNDFAAAGLGLPRLAGSDLVTLQHGLPREHGTRLVIGAGTGLGVGWLTWDGSRYRPHDSEAGHADFAPLDDLQDRLLVSLRRNFGRVSWERVVSGPGLMRIFSFLQEAGMESPSREMIEASKRRPDATEVIGEFGLARRDPLAVRALDLFVATYGAFAGNAALATLAHGGVYVAGGIAPKIVEKLQEGTFMRAFNDKGRFSDLLKTLPVYVVMNPKVGLYGALLEAERLAGGDPG